MQLPSLPHVPLASHCPEGAGPAGTWPQMPFVSPGCPPPQYSQLPVQAPLQQIDPSPLVTFAQKPLAQLWAPFQHCSPLARCTQTSEELHSPLMQSVAV